MLFSVTKVLRHWRGIVEKLFLKKGQPSLCLGWHSKRGNTNIVIFTGILTATRYVEILDAALLPFVRSQYPGGHCLYQDNDPKHTSRYIRGYFEEKDINWFKSPVESPNVNLIENIWDSMKTWLRNE